MTNEAHETLVRLIFNDSSQQGFSLVVRGTIGGVEYALRSGGFTSFDDQHGQRVVVNTAQILTAREESTL